jgi:hypothetical protein
MPVPRPKMLRRIQTEGPRLNLYELAVIFVNNHFLVNAAQGARRARRFSGYIIRRARDAAGHQSYIKALTKMLNY